MIAGAFSSTSGKADITLTTNGDVLYYNSGRQRLAIGSEGTVLTVSGSDLPAWEAAGGLSSPLTADLTVNDNINIKFGTGGDATFDYDGTNMLIDPKAVGSGVLSIAGRIQGLETGVGFAKMELLDHHIATGTESTYTFTPSTALDIQSTYAKIIVFFSGVNTASLAMQVKIDALTSYDYSKLLADTTTVSTALTTAAGAFEVIGTELIDGNSAFFAGALELWTLQSSGGTDRCMIRSVGWTAHEGNQICAGAPASGDTEEIASIEVLTSTSTWTANTEIFIYGVLR